MASAKSPPDLILLLTQAAHALETELTAALSDLGVSPRSYCVLAKALGGSLNQIELAELCALDKTTMVATIDELEKAGLAERKTSAEDRRARLIAVTPAGQRVVTRAEAIVSALYRDVLAALPPRDREAFVSGLQRLVAGRLANRVTVDKAPRRPRASARA